MADLVSAAIAMADAWLEVNNIRRRLATFDCERESAFLALNTHSNNYVEPCWKANKGSREGEDYIPPVPEEWCQTCQQRQVIYLALLAARRARGAKIRGLLALRRAMLAKEKT